MLPATPQAGLHAALQVAFVSKPLPLAHAPHRSLGGPQASGRRLVHQPLRTEPLVGTEHSDGYWPRRGELGGGWSRSLIPTQDSVALVTETGAEGCVSVSGRGHGGPRTSPAVLLCPGESGSTDWGSRVATQNPARVRKEPPRDGTEAVRQDTCPRSSQSEDRREAGTGQNKRISDKSAED